MEQAIYQRIYRQLFEVANDAQLRKRILFFPVSQKLPHEIKLIIRHHIAGTQQKPQEEMTIKFPAQYPQNPPFLQISSNTSKIQQVVLKSSLIQPQNWKAQTTLIDILRKTINLIDLFWQCFHNYGRNFSLMDSSIEQNNNIILSTQLNSQNTIQSLLIIKFEEIAREISSLANSQRLSEVFNLYKLKQANGSEILTKFLTFPQFKQTLKAQLNDGRWIHRILKSNISIKHKKQLIRYQSELLKEIQRAQTTMLSQENENK